jgi:hypothetical protein
MAFGGAIFLIALGAIIRYALDVDLAGIDLDVVGLILMIAGAAGLVLGFAVMLFNSSGQGQPGQPRQQGPPPR